MYSHVCITYADPANLTDSITVRYKLRSHRLVNDWVLQVESAQRFYKIDDPTRFYGLNPNAEQTAVDKINQCIDTINSHDIIIHKRVSSTSDADALNYLHHIFEVYHGLLNEQTHPFYTSAPYEVKKALADLNICVHGCETVARGNQARHVVTYFGLPKTKTLKQEDYQLFTDVYQFGTIYLNYVEIGKTLEDLAIDNDEYIGDDAFKPYNFYSADFVVMLHNSDVGQVMTKRDRMRAYYLKHSEFFLKRNLYMGHPTLVPGRIPLADIDSHGIEVLKLLEQRQYVSSVFFE